MKTVKNIRGRKKGTPRTGGRKKGTPNKVTSNLREFVTDFLTNNQSLILRDFKKLKSYERLQIFEKLLKYSLPTLQSVEAKIDVDKMDETQLKMIVDVIKTNLKCSQ